MAYDFGIVNALEHAAIDLVFGLKRLPGKERPFYDCVCGSSAQTARGVVALTAFHIA
jgi:hypothetical protein